jgi:hypothetical protein
MDPAQVEQWLGVARQVANADGPTIIVLVVFGLMTERLVTGRQYRAMKDDRNFFRDRFLRLTEDTDD